MGALESELKARGRSVQHQLHELLPHQSIHSDSSHPSTSAFMAREGINLTCCFCRQNHRSHQCPMVVHPASRKRTIGQCFLYIQRGHLGRECRPRSHCASCVRGDTTNIFKTDPAVFRKYLSHHQGIVMSTHEGKKGNTHTLSLASSIDLDLHLGANTFVPEQTENDYH